MTYQHIKLAIKVIDVAMTNEQLTALQASAMIKTIEGATAHDIAYTMSDDNLKDIRKATIDDRRRKNRARARRTS